MRMGLYVGPEDPDMFHRILTNDVLALLPWATDFDEALVSGEFEIVICFGEAALLANAIERAGRRRKAKVLMVHTTPQPKDFVSGRGIKTLFAPFQIPDFIEAVNELKRFEM